MNTIAIMDETALTPVAEIVIANPGAMTVFNKYHIDYCCSGKLALHAACEKAGASTKIVIDELRTIAGSHPPGVFRFDTWSVSLLTDFIIQNHHEYVKRSIPILHELLEKVYQVHGKVHPELKDVQENFEKISDELLDHMKKEELILFPTIRNIFIKQDHKTPFDFIESLQMVENEHEQVGNLIKTIRSLTQNYTPPASACATYSLTYLRLAEFDQDLMQHIHLENNVLFRKVRTK